jgi:hypothetical protein
MSIIALVAAMIKYFGGVLCEKYFEINLFKMAYNMSDLNKYQ